MRIVSVEHIADAGMYRRTCTTGMAARIVPIVLVSMDHLFGGIKAVVACGIDCVGERGSEDIARMTTSCLQARGYRSHCILPDGEKNPTGYAGMIMMGTIMSESGHEDDTVNLYRSFSSHYCWTAYLCPGEPFPNARRAYDESIIAGFECLDDHIPCFDGLILAMLSGWHRPDADYITRLEELRSSKHDLLAMHDGPDFSSCGLSDSTSIREVLGKSYPTPVICCDPLWDELLVELPNQTQVLNVAGRIAILVSRNT